MLKILHLMLGSFYIDNYSYQENILPRLNLEHGHQVKIIASTETFLDNLKLGYTNPGTYFNEDGIEVTRVPYRKSLFPRAMRKIRAYSGVKELIEEYGPDIILFHGIQAYEILTVAEYKRLHPTVRFYGDNHADQHNSGKSLISKWILHRLVYRAFISRTMAAIDKILCISLETMDFVHSNYGVPMDKLEFYPLGGLILDEAQRMAYRANKRQELGVSSDQILFLHSGKMDHGKRTEDILKAFSAIPDPRFRLVLIGSMSKEVESTLEPMILGDPRISYLGWKTADQLLQYLCACDMYLQPGGQSATMQNALCVFCPVMIYPHKSHQPFLRGNGYFVTNSEEIRRCLMLISEDPAILQDMRESSKAIAMEIIDYHKLASRLYQ